ncbi:MAG TPA: hypothetical protein VIZ90_01690, partial [Rhizobiaceae bacterium]
AGESGGEASLVLRLVREIGITEAQAIELVALLGANWSSLVREARIIRRDDARAQARGPA